MTAPLGDAQTTRPTLIDAVLEELQHPPRLPAGPSAALALPGAPRLRPVACHRCHHRVLPHQLLAHLQTAHGEEVFHRTASGLPRGIWFSAPAPGRRLR
ncbi:MAG: hypothetical protein RLZZ592_1235 [Pseudomonadota bacterium]|jgi:hypothetical protein